MKRDEALLHDVHTLLGSTTHEELFNPGEALEVLVMRQANVFGECLGLISRLASEVERLSTEVEELRGSR